MPGDGTKPHFSVCCSTKPQARAIFSAQEVVTGVCQVFVFATKLVKKMFFKIGSLEKKIAFLPPNISKTPFIYAPRQTHKNTHTYLHTCQETKLSIRQSCSYKLSLLPSIHCYLFSKIYYGRCGHSKNFASGEHKSVYPVSRASK